MKDLSVYHVLIRHMKQIHHIRSNRFVFALALFSASRVGASLINTGYLGSSAVTQGMGGAHSALGGDSEDYILNPADLALQKTLSVDLQGGALFDSSSWLMGMLVSPALESSVGLALGTQRISTANSQDNQQTWMLGAGIPLRADGDTAVGFTLKYFSEDYGDPGTSLGLDLGLIQRLHFGDWVVGLAASLLDVDSVVQYESGLEERLPQVIKLGLGFEWGRDLSFAIDDDIVDSSDSVDGSSTGNAIHAGVEKKFWDQHVALRLGYISLANENVADTSGAFGGSGDRATLGVGFNYQRLRIDYAYLPSSGGVGDTHRLGATLDLFGGAADSTEAVPAQALKFNQSLRGDKMVFLSWDDPQGRPDTSYVILMSYRPDTLFSRLTQTGGGQTSLELRGLENGHTYYFRVATMNSSGTGVEATLSGATGLTPEALPEALAGTLSEARAALEKGDIASAKALAEQARELDPNCADTELLIQRLRRLR